MNTSSDAAEQLVRMSLNTAEVAVKVTGNGAKNIAVMLYAIVKDQHQTKGKTRLNNMLKSGQPLKVYEVRDNDLQKFCEEAKRYGVLYCVLKDKNANDDMTDIMVREFDSAKINRIFERFGLAEVSVARLQPETDKNRVDKIFDENEMMWAKMEMHKRERQNFFTARGEHPDPSGRSLKDIKGSGRGHEYKPSVKSKLNDITEQSKKNVAKTKNRGMKKQSARE